MPGTAAEPTFPLTGGCLCGGARFEVSRPLVRTYGPPDGWAKLFCSACGSALFSQSQADPEQMTIRLGAFDSDPGVRPQARYHVRTAAAWEPIPDDGLPRHDGGRTSVAQAAGGA